MIISFFAFFLSGFWLSPTGPDVSADVCGDMIFAAGCTVAAGVGIGCTVAVGIDGVTVGAFPVSFPTFVLTVPVEFLNIQYADTQVVAVIVFSNIENPPIANF